LAKHQEKLKPNNTTSVSPLLAECYQVCFAGRYDMMDDDIDFDISDCLLSPRATYIYHSDGRTPSGFSACLHCKKSLSAGYKPKFCIANNYCFGTTPNCLLQLTDIELAMITPVKTYGYCFSYTGGVQKQLKGSLSYYKVAKDSIVRSAAHFEALGLNNNVIVLLYGHMTSSQYHNAKKKNKIRTNYILDAIRWLLINNVEWQNLHLSFHDIIARLKNPILVDNTVVDDDGIDAGNNYSVADTETFQVFFPDGTISTMTGGQAKIDDFQELVKEAAINGYDIEYRCSLFKEAVSDYKDNNLINACLLQFPFGRGGMHEEREKSDGTITTDIDISEYIKYLSFQSQPQFHRELFTLILYNMEIKQTMVKTAGWKVRNKADANVLANELTMEDVDDAINATRYARGTSNNSILRGRKLLGSIDTICKTIPHTNEAARRARRDAETLQHHFGCPTFFLTVTPDDDNSYLVQVYSQHIIDNTENISQLSDQVLFERAKERTQLRIRFPGICAYFFEMALDIIIQDVIGWDLKKRKPIEDAEGLFGKVNAFSVSVEEQGRHTLHAHILIWVTELNEKRELLYSPYRHIRRFANSYLTKKVDAVASTKCFF
jgi:hypothetical protein